MRWNNIHRISNPAFSSPFTEGKLPSVQIGSIFPFTRFSPTNQKLDFSAIRRKELYEDGCLSMWVSERGVFPVMNWSRKSCTLLSSSHHSLHQSCLVKRCTHASALVWDFYIVVKNCLVFWFFSFSFTLNSILFCFNLVFGTLPQKFWLLLKTHHFYSSI